MAERKKETKPPTPHQPNSHENPHSDTLKYKANRSQIAGSFALAILETENATCRFGGLVAVDSVNYKLERDELAALIGPNGAGKSTLLKMIAGMWYPTSGRIRFEGRDITRMPPQERAKIGIAKTFQITKVFTRMTVLENVVMALRSSKSKTQFYIYPWNDRESVEKAEKILERMNLLSEKNKLAGALPHGSRKRVEVGMAIATNPKLILMDEPTSGSTATETHQMGNLIKELATTVPVLVVEHKMDFVMGLARRISVMHQGKIIADGSPEEIRRDSLVRDIYLGAYK